MKFFYFSVPLMVFSLLLLSCQSQVPEDSSEESAIPDSDLGLTSVIDIPDFPLEASFMSERQTFSYHFLYDGQLLQLMDTPFSGSRGLGPSFQVEGGAELTAYTDWLSSLETIPSFASTQIVGLYEVTRYAVLDGECTVEKGVVEYGEEGLVLQLRLCSGDGGEKGKEAMENLLEGLSLEALP